MRILTRKLDSQSYKDWHRSVDWKNPNPPSIENLLDLLEKNALSEDSPPDIKNYISLSTNISNNFDDSVVLGTAKASLLNSTQDRFPINILLDPGSQISCIFSHTAAKFPITKMPINIQLKGIANTNI